MQLPNDIGGKSVRWDRIYEIDLVYQSDCWRSCGDAHCCHFTRHKARFRLLGNRDFQELPLLPGEFEHLQTTGALARFRGVERRITDFPIDRRRSIRIDSLVSPQPSCPCEHAARPTICRLYPLFPIHDVDGRLLGVETRFGIYEELEHLHGLPRVCQVGQLPFDQLGLYLELTGMLARSPVHLFHLHAYRLAKRHVVAAVQQHLPAKAPDAFAVFEWLLVRGRLVAKDTLRAELAALADTFAARYGDDFRLPEPLHG